MHSVITNFKSIEKFSYDLEKWFRLSVRYFVLSKIKTWTLRFPAKENPNMQTTMFDWPIVFQYDVKAKYQLISGKFSGIDEGFNFNRTFPKAIPFCIRSINHNHFA